MRRIWLIYKYIFYREYSWHKAMFGNKDFPQFSAIIGMSISFWMILFTLASLTYIFFDIKIVSLYVTNFKMIIPMFIVLGGHYFLFLHKGKHLEIEKEFESEELSLRKRNGWLVVLYSVGTILIFLATLILGIHFKNE